MAGTIHELLLTEVAGEKLGGRGISAGEVAQIPRNPHVTIGNPRSGAGNAKRRLMIGLTGGGRALTLVVEATLDGGTWLIVTGWSATDAERRLLGR